MFKWFCMICKLFFPFLFLLPKLKKHAKHKEKYSLEFRYQTVLSLKKRKYKPFSVQARVCQPISYETFLEHKHDFTTYAHDLLKQELAILRKEQSQ